MTRYKIQRGIDEVCKSFAGNTEILQGVGETIGSPDEIEVHLEPVIADFNEMHELARWFKDLHKKAEDKLKKIMEAKGVTRNPIYRIEEAVNVEIDMFLEAIVNKQLSLDDLVTKFNGVQKDINSLVEQAEYLETKNEEIQEELDELTIDNNRIDFDQSLKLSGGLIRIVIYGKTSMINQETLERVLGAIEKDEILCNQNVNAFF